MTDGALIGRDVERAQLEAALARAEAGEGALVLLRGEAGIGKTRLVSEVVGDKRLLRGAATPGGAPFSPVVAALRAFLRAEPDGLSHCGPLRSHLALLLPELGPTQPTDDRATLFEAIRCALVSVAARGPAVILLDDVQWSDAATLELLAALAPGLSELSLLVVAAYRSDDLPQGHPLRRLRHDLRRDRVLHELSLAPLDADESALLVAQAAGASVRAVGRHLAHAHGWRPLLPRGADGGAPRERPPRFRPERSRAGARRGRSAAADRPRRRSRPGLVAVRACRVRPRRSPPRSAPTSTSSWPAKTRTGWRSSSPPG